MHQVDKTTIQDQIPTLPVADVRPWIPPWVMGLPVTQADEFMSLYPEK